VRLSTPNCLPVLVLLTATQILTSQVALAHPTPAGPWQSPPSSTADSAPGIELLTDPKGVDLRVYLGALMSAVKRKWYEGMPASARQGDRGEVSVQFRVQQDGKLLDSSLKVASSSGKKDLDDASLNAIRNAAPFSHLPSKLRQPFIEMRVHFQYNMGTKSTDTQQ
jgi:TonB family protein